MGNKVKMKCANCHKPFKSNKASQIYCDDCERKRRLEKAAAASSTAKGGTTPMKGTSLSAATPARPTWLEKAVEHDPTTDPVLPPAPRERPTIAARALPEDGTAATIVRPAFGKRAPSIGQKLAKAPTPRPPREKVVKEKKEPPKKYEPTTDEIALIEARYIELAQPEFDGIRSLIAQEMQIPKHVVKKIVAELRTKEHIPSWWDMQAYSGSAEDLERIREKYVPYLPVPPIGVHRQLATALDLSPTLVYRGIRAIRQTMHLPVFNPAESHPELVKPAESTSDSTP